MITPAGLDALKARAASNSTEPVSLDMLIDAKVLINERKIRDTSPEMLDAFAVLCMGRLYNGACEWTIRALPRKRGGDGETRHHSFLNEIAPLALYSLVRRVRELTAELGAAKLSAASPSTSAHLESLTPRERDALSGLARGETAAQAGRRLGISRRTIEAHRQSLMKKLGRNNRADLVRFAVAVGL